MLLNVVNGEISDSIKRSVYIYKSGLNTEKDREREKRRKKESAKYTSERFI